MKEKMILLALLISLECLFPKVSKPCTSFCIDNGEHLLFGTNLDWDIADGLVIINKRGVSKTAMKGSEKFQNLTKWNSKYASITFNQYGREIPWSGMNESGLVISTMMLGETEYPGSDARSSVESSQWLQYQLDSFSAVKEVIASDSSIRIKTSVGIGCHYLVCDSHGKCASIEFLKGKLVSHTEDSMPFKVLTNSTYEDAIAYLRGHIGFGGQTPISDSTNSLERFARAANMVTNYNLKKAGSPIDYAFAILNNVAFYYYTKWSIVYDVKNRYVYFRTSKNQDIRYVKLDFFNPSCPSPVKILDINNDLSGDVTGNFIDYKENINRNLIQSTYKQTYFLSDIEDEILEKIARYPETTTCID